MQVICPAPRRKIQASQHIFILFVFVISSFRTLEQTSALNGTRFKLSNASALSGHNPRFVCDCFGDSKRFRALGLPLVFLPGIYFGMVLGLAIWFWVSRILGKYSLSYCLP